MENNLGAKLLVDGPERQGQHLLLAGQALQNYREAGLSDKALVDHIDLNGGRMRRIDLAVNIHAGETSVHDLLEQIEQGKAKTLASKGKAYRDMGQDGEGFYWGSRTSDRFMRCYDKRAEQQLVDSEAWLRLELVCRNTRAELATEAIVTNANTRAVINRAIKDYLYFPEVPEVVSALSDDNAEIEGMHRPEPALIRWLINQVAPAIYRYETEHPDESPEAVLHQWLQVLRGQSNCAEGTNRRL